MSPDHVSRYTLLLPSKTSPCGRICVWLFTPISSAVTRGGHCRGGAPPVGGAPLWAGLMSMTSSGSDTWVSCWNVARLNRCRLWGTPLCTRTAKLFAMATPKAFALAACGSGKPAAEASAPCEPKTVLNTAFSTT